jgi:type II secretion system protein G
VIKIKDRGFTLIELMIVMLIIGLLSSVIVPNYNKIQIKAKEQSVQRVVNKLQIAVESYLLDVGSYPDGNNIDIQALEDILISNNDLSSYSKNPFTGLVYTSNDSSGMVTYTFDEDTDTYSLSALGYKNNEEIVSIGNQ